MLRMMRRPSPQLQHVHTRYWRTKFQSSPTATRHDLQLSLNLEDFDLRKRTGIDWVGSKII
jgi:hypothetical protein